MTKMPILFPIMFIVIASLGFPDWFKTEITRTDIFLATGMICWAILSRNEVKE
jgi:hypothetical protein